MPALNGNPTLHLAPSPPIAKRGFVDMMKAFLTHLHLLRKRGRLDHALRGAQKVMVALAATPGADRGGLEARIEKVKSLAAPHARDLAATQLRAVCEIAGAGAQASRANPGTAERHHLAVDEARYHSARITELQKRVEVLKHEVTQPAPPVQAPPPSPSAARDPRKSTEVVNAEAIVRLARRAWLAATALGFAQWLLGGVCLAGEGLALLVTFAATFGIASTEGQIATAVCAGLAGIGYIGAADAACKGDPRLQKLGRVALVAITAGIVLWRAAMFADMFTTGAPTVKPSVAAETGMLVMHMVLGLCTAIAALWSAALFKAGAATFRQAGEPANAPEIRSARLILEQHFITLREARAAARVDAREQAKRETERRTLQRSIQARRRTESRHLTRTLNRAEVELTWHRRALRRVLSQVERAQHRVDARALRLAWPAARAVSADLAHLSVFHPDNQEGTR